jgi:hypothetical protein
MIRKRSFRYVIESKRGRFIVVDSKGETKKQRELESFSSYREAIDKCRLFNQSDIDWDDDSLWDGD